jgi:DNA repair exonuclease SbcCD ATPase subunit
MKILTLTLKNFRSHQATVLDLDRFNFIRGPKPAGGAGELGSGSP